MFKQTLRPLLALFVFTGAASAQTSVWKITSGKNTIYLGGTIHVLRATDFPLPKEFDQAFAASTALYFETDLSRLTTPEAQQLLLSRGMYDDGTTLDKVLSPAAWEALQKYANDTGLPLEGLSKVKPWLITVMMAAIELQKLGVSQEGVDLHYFKLAAGAGKSVHSLEPFEKHIEYVTSLGAGHESELVLNSIEELADMNKQVDEMLIGWRKGDIKSLEGAMLDHVHKRYPAIYAQLVVERNNNWMPTITELLKTPETEFILVGTGHLVGPDGLLAVLRKRGYKVEQLKAN